MGDTYSHGHHESVLRSHTWRTAENSAGYLLGSLTPGQRLLDVGCGPGTITLDLATRVSPGRVIGIDSSAEVVAEAQRNRDLAGIDADRVRFRTGDAYALEFDDGALDVVHAHQVLQHLSDPLAALGEMRRVLRPGGILAVRDSDYGAFAWAPSDPVLTRWIELYHELTAANGAEADAGRYLLGWVQRAGFTAIEATSSTWTFAEPESRSWWGELWADRVEHSAFAEQTSAYGLSDPDERAEIAAAFRRWAAADDAVFIVVHGEVLARR